MVPSCQPREGSAVAGLFALETLLRFISLKIETEPQLNTRPDRCQERVAVPP